MWSDVEARATKLREVLGGLDLQLDQSECLQVLSKIQQWPAGNTRAAGCGNDQQELAELFLDELLEAISEVNYTKFVKRFEKKYLAIFTESEFKRSIRNRFEDDGNYIGRIFLGLLNGQKHPGDDRYPNKQRYIWRVFFEKNEALIQVSIYRKHGTHYISGAHAL